MKPQFASLAAAIIAIGFGAGAAAFPDQQLWKLIFLLCVIALAICLAWWGASSYQIVKRKRPRNTFENERVRINDLVTGANPMLIGCQFTKCIVEGPGHLKAEQDCHFESIGSPLPVDANMTVVDEGRSIRGAILMGRVTFTHCYFDGIALIGTAESARQLLPAFDQVTLSDWKRRVGYIAD
jgi:hypothetical protein